MNCWTVRSCRCESSQARTHDHLTEKLKNAKPNLNVLKDYKKREEEWNRRAKDLEDVTLLRDQQKQKYDDLRKQRLDEFMTGFNTISLKLKEMYKVSVSVLRLWRLPQPLL